MTNLEIFLVCIVLVLLVGLALFGAILMMTKWVSGRIGAIHAILDSHSASIRETGKKFGDAVEAIERSSSGLQGAVSEMSKQVAGLINSVAEARSFHERVLSGMTEEFAAAYSKQYERGTREIKEAMDQVAANGKALEAAVLELPKYEQGMVRIVDKLVLQVQELTYAVESFRRMMFPGDSSPRERQRDRDALIPYQPDEAFIKAEKDELIRSGLLPSEAEAQVRDAAANASRFIEEALGEQNDVFGKMELR